MAKKFLKEYEVLLIKAKEDLIASKYILDGFNNHGLELRLEIVFFHFQQCGEKLLKSVLDLNGIQFPRTHDLEILLQLLVSNDIDLVADVNNLVELTDYAVESRYAILLDDMEDTGKYIEVLDQLLLFVEESIALISGDDDV
jgi:HEPN domain-containing protein